MARSALASVLSLGLPAVFGVFSFAACYVDMTSEKGKCQPPTTPVDECTVYKCKADGTPAPEPVANAENKVCFRGENEGVCVDGACALTCETQGTPCKCAADTECPVDKQCLDWACDMGQCKSTQVPNGMVVDTLEMFDCKAVQCQNGVPQTVADTADFNTMDTMLGDCKMPACNGDMPSLDPKTDDFPPSNGCTSFTCSATGDIVPMMSPIGQACAAGACDSTGACVDCLTDTDYSKCKGSPEKCAVPKCGGQPCAADNECKTMFCADNFCCDSACTGECKSCGITGKEGTCTSIPYLDGDKSYTDPITMVPGVSCDAPFFCSMAGKCLGGFGAPCTVDGGCLSGKCPMPSKICLGAKDEPCTNNGQCASGTCTANKCT